MPKYRKRPVVIEARQFTESDAEFPATIEMWCNGNVRGMFYPPRDRIIQINTLEGEFEGRVGDWIIRGVRGEFYPCKPDIFALTYEETPDGE